MSVLNVGQNLTITAGVVVAMWVAASAAVGGAINIGDFVLINQVRTISNDSCNYEHPTVCLAEAKCQIIATHE